MRQRGLGERVLILALVLTGAGSAAVADDDPAQVLKARGLKASGHTYVLEAEAEVLTKVHEVEALFDPWQAAATRQAAVAEAEIRIKFLTEQTAYLRPQVDAARRQVGTLPRRASSVVINNHMMAQAQYNEMKANYDALTQQLALLKSQMPDARARKALTEEVDARVEPLTKAVRELRAKVDPIQATYHELARVEEVKAAINALGRPPLPKPKLGPSKEFLAAVRKLHRAEHVLPPDPLASLSGPDGSTKGARKARTKAKP